MHRVVFLGPPGAGKGTQAAILAGEFHIAHLSTGDMLRAAVAARSELGREAEGHMAAGRLVPDDLVLRILAEHLRRPEAENGFILDGFPRNLAQAQALDRIVPIETVISFDIPLEKLVQRLTARRVCPKCQSVYNLDSRPPRVPGRCDHDGTELVHRPDDHPEPVATRLAVYAEQTAPLLGFYDNRGILHRIDASGAPGEVTDRIRALLRRAR